LGTPHVRVDQFGGGGSYSFDSPDTRQDRRTVVAAFNATRRTPRPGDEPHPGGLHQPSSSTTGHGPSGEEVRRRVADQIDRIVPLPGPDRERFRQRLDAHHERLNSSHAD
jgi:hypothetical protein